MTLPSPLATIASLRHWNGVRVGIAGVAAAVVMACALPAAAGAQAIVNTTLDTDPDGCTVTPDGCTLREAVTESAESEVQVPAGADYVLTRGQILINRNVTIRGTGAGLATIRPAIEFPSRVFEVAPPATS